MTNLTTPGQVTLKAAMLAWLILGIYLGALAGSGEFSTLKLVVATILIVFHIVCFLHQTWSLGFGMAVLDLWLVGFGFKISAVEVSLTITVALMACVSWRKVLLRPPPECESNSFRALNISFAVFIGYMIAHLVFNHLSPYQIEDYALKNFLRTVIWTGGPMAVLWFLINKPSAVRSRNSFPKVLAAWMFVTLIFNIGVRIYEMISGAEYVMGEANVAASFIIPVIEAAPNMYALRSLPLLGALIGLSYLGTDWMKTQTRGTHLLFTLLVIVSVIGALLSSGRAATAIVVLVVLVFLFLRGWTMLVTTFSALALMAVLILNLVPGSISILPPAIQRSVAMLVFTEYTEARAAIDNSSDWRKEVAWRAYGEWLTNSRTFWFGRGSYSYTEEDDKAIMHDGFEGFTESAVRRGATHNLVTDMLIVHGLVGLLLYFFCVGALMVFLWKCRNSKSNDEIGRRLANLSFVHLGITFGLGLIGGGFLPVTTSWLTGLLVGHLYRLENDDPSRRPARIGGRQRETVLASTPAASRRRAARAAQPQLAREI